MTYRSDIESAAKYLQQGLHKRALKSALSAARKSPNQPVAFNLAGIALSATGKPNDAIAQFQKALKLHPDYTDAIKNMAQTLILTGRADQAVKMLDRAAKKAPKDWPTWNLMAKAHNAIGEKNAARDSVDIAIELAPKHGPNYHLRSSILMQMGLLDDAIADLETAMTLNPNDVQALIDMCMPLARQTRTQEALSAISKAVLLDPENLPARFRLGTQLIEMGQTEEGIAQYRAVLDRAPDHPATLERLVEVLPSQEAVLLEKNIRASLKKVAKPSEDRASLFFALSKVLKAADRKADAQKALASANEELGKLVSYDAETDAQITRSILDQFPAGFAFNQTPQDGPFPIFILGLPRSGTTLAETILGLHPQVAPLGERGTLGFLLEDAIARNQPANALDTDDLNQQLRRQLPDLTIETQAFVDKMPENYRLIGYLRQVHPNARFIQITRDPRDIALSMWKAHFSGAALSYSYDFQSMAHKFNLYAETMAHWHRILPDQILSLSYEAMVRDVEGAGKQMAAFCGLDWVSEMARPDQSTAQVMTLSATQLRQPVHTGSIGKWQDEAELLAPFVAALDAEYWADLL